MAVQTGQQPTTESTLTRIWQAGRANAAILALMSLALVLITALELPLAALAVTGAIGGTFLMVRPRLGLYLLLLAIPYSDAYSVRVATFRVAVTDFLIIGVLVVWLLRLLARGTIPLPNTPILAAWLFYLGVLVASVQVAWDPVFSIKEILKWVQMLLVYVAFTEMIHTRAQIRTATMLLFLAALSQAGVAVTQWLLKIGPANFASRVYGSFGQPNPFAGYLNTIIPLAVALTVLGLLHFRREYIHDLRLHFAPPNIRTLCLLAAVTAGITLTALYQSLSRGAWVGLGIALAVMAVQWNRRILPLLLIGIPAALLLLVAIAVVGILPPELTSRLGDIVLYFGVFDVNTVRVTPQNWPVVERMAHWQAGWYMFLDHPFLGVGVGNYTPAYPTYLQAGWYYALDHAHNFYINAAAETGLVGLIAVLVLFGTWLREVLLGLRRTSRQPSLDRAILIGVLGALVAGMMHNMFDNLFVHGIGVQVAVLIALATATRRVASSDSAASAESH